MRNRSPAEWIAAGRAALAFVAVYAMAMGAFLLLTSCASLQEKAETAAVADGVTTVAAIAAGATELNPVGAIFAVGVKLPALMYARTLPEDERAEFHAIAGPVWGAAAANNLCVIAVLLTGGIAAPCIAVGVGYGLYAWQESKQERNFYAACAEYRRIDPSVTRCEYRLAQQ